MSVRAHQLSLSVAHDLYPWGYDTPELGNLLEEISYCSWYDGLQVRVQGNHPPNRGPEAQRNDKPHLRTRAGAFLFFSSGGRRICDHNDTKEEA